MSAPALADLIRDCYLERVALLMRHEDVAVTVTDYDINNAYQYIIAREETQFARTLDAGTGHLEAALRTRAVARDGSPDPASWESDGVAVQARTLERVVGRRPEDVPATSLMMSGADAFKLHDTYGFPIDLSIELAAEYGYAVDRATVRQKKTGRPVRFELTEQTRQAINAYIAEAGKNSASNKRQ